MNLAKRSQCDESLRRGRPAFAVIAVLTLLLTSYWANNSNTQPQESPQEQRNRQPVTVRSGGPINHRRDDSSGPDRRENDIQVFITPIAYSDTTFHYEPTNSFRSGRPILIRLSMLNTSAEPLDVSSGAPLLQHRLRLRKDGRVVRYRQDILPVLRERENFGSPLGGPRFSTTLIPNEMTNVETLDLSRWYGSLEPGRYELTLRHRFRRRGRPVESSTVTFDVVP